MQKSSNKKNAIVSIMLIAAIAITGAFAYLTATDTATNLFTVGNVVVELTEPNWAPDTDSDGNGINDTMSNIVAGQVIEKDPTITNKGDNDAYVYIMVEIPKVYETEITGADGSAATQQHYPLFSFDANDGWSLIDSQVGTEDDAYDYYLYAYDTALTPNGEATLFDEVKFANITDNFVNTITGEAIVDLDIKVTGYAIQSDYYNGEATDAASAWSLYATQNDWAWPENAYEGISTLKFVNEDNIVVHTVSDYAGTPVDMYFEPDLAKTGYTFDWVNETTGDVGYSGMPMPAKNTELTATYTETGYSSENPGYWVVHVLYDEIKDEFYGHLVNADPEHEDYPDSPTTVVIPSSININVTHESSGAIYLTSDDCASVALANYNSTMPVPSDGEIIIKKFSFGTHLASVAETLVLPDGMETLYYGNENAITKNVVLPYGIKSIESQFFMNNDELENINFTNTITKLGPNVFKNCKNLKEIELKASVQEIGEWCFQDCTSLEKVTIRSVKELGKGMFNGCTSLNNVLLGGVEIIGVDAFNNCTSLESIVFPNTLKTISTNAFGFCSSLKEVVFNEGLETIGAYAFVDSPIEYVYIPDSVINIGGGAFYMSTADPLFTASVPSSCVIDESAFSEWAYQVTYR